MAKFAILLVIFSGYLTGCWHSGNASPVSAPMSLSVESLQALPTPTPALPGGGQYIFPDELFTVMYGNVSYAQLVWKGPQETMPGVYGSALLSTWYCEAGGYFGLFVSGTYGNRAECGADEIVRFYTSDSDYVYAYPVLGLNVVIEK